jgi:hypothetical protein
MRWSWRSTFLEDEGFAARWNHVLSRACEPGDGEGGESDSRNRCEIGEAKELWKKKGLEAKIVSGGSTPTAYFSHEFKT